MIAVALGCDAFAVGLGVGTRCSAGRQVFRLSFHFGLFQFLMPIIGGLLGHHLANAIRLWGAWVAFALLAFIGGRMILESLRGAEEEVTCPDPTKGTSLVMLSVATSLDALGVGFTLGLLGRELLVPALWIGIVAGVMTFTAMKLGKSLSTAFGRRLGAVGGVILLIIAVKLVSA